MLIEYRVWQWFRNWLPGIRRPDGWPNRDHPPTHRWWRSWLNPFGQGRICYYCGLTTARDG